MADPNPTNGTQPPGAKPKVARSRRRAARIVPWVVAGLLALVVTWAWMLIERNPGDTTIASFSKVALEFDEHLVFQPESDGISGRVSAMAVSNTSEISIEPCSLGEKQCKVTSPTFARTSVVIKRVESTEPSKTSHVRFTPIARVRNAGGRSPEQCSAKVELSGSREGVAKLALRAEHVAENCVATLETVIFDENATADGESTLVLHVLEGVVEKQPKVRELRLKCLFTDQPAPSDPRTRNCRITLRTALVAEKTKTDYIIGENSEAVLLRGIEDDEPTLLSLRGELAPRAPDDAPPARCRNLPGDSWSFDSPKLRRLALSDTDPPTLRAAFQGYGGVSCSPPINDFIFRLVVVLGVPTLLELGGYLRKLLRRRLPRPVKKAHRGGKATPAGGRQRNDDAHTG